MSDRVKCLKEQKQSPTSNVSKYCISLYIILTTPLFCSLTCLALLFPSAFPILVLKVLIISVGIFGPLVSKEGRKKSKLDHKIELVRRGQQYKSRAKERHNVAQGNRVNLTNTGE